MSGILHFVLVDIRAACELLDVIHSLDKSGGEVTIEHYDVVREEIAYREKDSFWINGISVINAVIGMTAVALFVLASQQAIITKSAPFGSSTEWHKIGLVASVYIKFFIFAFLVFLEVAKANEKASDLVKTLGVIICKRKGPMHFPLYTLFQPIEFKIFNYRVTKANIYGLFFSFHFSGHSSPLQPPRFTRII
jgi:hypothetical protein